jgi:hypothetical protein
VHLGEDFAGQESSPVCIYCRFISFLVCCVLRAALLVECKVAAKRDADASVRARSRDAAGLLRGNAAPAA